MQNNPFRECLICADKAKRLPNKIERRLLITKGKRILISVDLSSNNDWNLKTLIGSKLAKIQSTMAFDCIYLYEGLCLFELHRGAEIISPNYAFDYPEDFKSVELVRITRMRVSRKKQDVRYFRKSPYYNAREIDEQFFEVGKSGLSMHYNKFNFSFWPNPFIDIDSTRF